MRRRCGLAGSLKNFAHERGASMAGRYCGSGLCSRGGVGAVRVCLIGEEEFVVVSWEVFAKLPGVSAAMRSSWHGLLMCSKQLLVSLQTHRDHVSYSSLHSGCSTASAGRMSCFRLSRAPLYLRFCLATRRRLMPWDLANCCGTDARIRSVKQSRRESTSFATFPRSMLFVPRSCTLERNA